MPSHPRLVLAGLLVTAACSGGDDDVEPYNCADETRDEEFTAGMQKTGAGGVTFTLRSSDPAPPARGDNTWLVGIADGATPFEGEVSVTPFMPDHRHGTSIEAVVTPVAGTPGDYTVEPVNLFMPGLWEITIEAGPATARVDRAVFSFCISG